MLLRWIAVGIARLPAWLQPATAGALAAGAATLFIVITSLPSLLREPQPALKALAVLALASGAGACGGLVYTIVGRRLPSDSRLREIPRRNRLCGRVYHPALCRDVSARRDRGARLNLLRSGLPFDLRVVHRVLRPRRGSNVVQKAARQVVGALCRLWSNRRWNWRVSYQVLASLALLCVTSSATRFARPRTIHYVIHERRPVDADRRRTLVSAVLCRDVAGCRGSRSREERLAGARETVSRRSPASWQALASPSRVARHNARIGGYTHCHQPGRTLP